MKRFIAECLLIILLILVSTQAFSNESIYGTQMDVSYDSFASNFALQCSNFCIQLITIFFQIFYIFVTQWIG